MTRPSKGAAIFLTFFGLMFLIPSVLAFFAFITGKPGQPVSGKIAGAAIAAVFVAIGAGFVFAAVAGYRKLKEQAATEEANPQSPWLWKHDWAASRAESQNKGREITLWVVCIFCNVILLPIVTSALPDLINKRDPRAFLLVGFASIGVILFVAALRASLRHHRFGNTYFEFYSLPFSPGGRLAGKIHFQFESRADHGIDLRLSCIRKTITGVGNNRSTVQTVLWQADQNVSSGLLGMDSSGRTIPVDFAIPANGYMTDHDNPSDQVLWMLHAEADVPGMNYRDDFEVPVFRTSAANVTTDSSASPAGFDSASAPDADSGAVSAPSHPQVVISSQGGGTEFYFRPFRSPSRAVFLLVFAAIWTGAVYLLFRSNAPWFFAAVFGLTDVLVIFALFHVALSSTRILVGNGEIVRTTRTLGIGSTKHFPVAEIDALFPVTSGQQGNGPQNTVYGIRLRAKNGQRFTLADEITSRQEARWIVSQIESLSGMKIDTSVQWDAPLGVSATPPQPGQQVFISTRLGWQNARPASAKTTVISFAIFGLFVVSMFAWQGWRFSTLRSMANSRARTSRPSAASKVPAKRVFAQPMTDADVARINTLPTQDQAEELLERAIEHDSRALELFQQNVEGWLGKINMSDRMRQLERRSEFSSDLRVRYANADLNLTLEGWQKNDQAAGLLIERAQTDQRYRAGAVYFLGMLAGRGVAYDKIHPVLLNYAKHDPDATVRQWAVEGMRYLGKDEALRELWESFTQDPAMNVRNRAGCNISDCGNFTRLQRMRMVPKFLELLQDSKTNPQMRAWCFMALREITDVNLQGDPQVWQDWYGKHGAGKLAEFEAQDWWRIRGDE
jgi:hypothetical protein